MERNRVAIVSFFKSENYGAILQATALQQVIAMSGFHPRYLDYKNDKNLSLPRCVLNIAYTIVRYCLGYKTRAKKTRDFIKQNLSIDQYQGEECYDIFVVGSDQVWFPGYVNDFFLLKFVTSKKKISYASSFGVSHLPPSYYNYFYNGLSSFDALSTREDSGKTIIASLGFESKVVLDPTLLLNASYWNHKLVIPSIRVHYILCYVMNGDSLTARIIFKQAQELSQRLHNRCRILIIGDKEYKKMIPGYHVICSAGPAEFLGYIKNADFIITSSFHGTCFSILFEKDFINILRKDNPVNNRVEELTRRLGLSSRIYYTDLTASETDASPIDYRPVRVKLEVMREESLNYLKNSLS